MLKKETQDKNKIILEDEIKWLNAIVISLEKQIPKKSDKSEHTDCCPVCQFELYQALNYCPNCGQRLDWSVDNE